MDYFDKKKNVEEYIKMAEGYDGRELIETLKKHLQPGLKVLELGMGPGKDFDILKKNYEVTGSDKSRIFLERYKKKNKEADLLQLDAINIETGFIPEYDDLRKLFKKVLDKDYSCEDYIKQFTVRIPENLLKIERISRIYKDLNEEIPSEFFKIMDEQKSRLQKLQSEKGDYVSPFDF